jgi:hypothetical protein
MEEVMVMSDNVVSLPPAPSVHVISTLLRRMRSLVLVETTFAKQFIVDEKTCAFDWRKNTRVEIDLEPIPIISSYRQSYNKQIVPDQGSHQISSHTGLTIS